MDRHDTGRRRSWLRGAPFVALGLAISLYGTALLARQAEGARSYERLRAPATAAVASSGEDEAEARSASTDADAAEGDQRIDWEALRSIDGQVAAWISLEGADVSLPVCQAEADAPNYYLDHDLWGNESVAGCLYVDCRTSADARHVLVYGHHLVGTGGMLSSLYTCSEQDVFDKVLSGDLSWSTPAQGTRRLRPLCALSVDQSFDDIQTFGFESDRELQAWLERLCAQASARAPCSSELVRHARCAISLVTCSSLLSGQRGRTIVVLVGS